MTYNPVTDFQALLRQSGSSVELERMPGLDYVVAALARAGMISVSVSQTAPVVNQSSTVWLKPSVPSWVAEGVVFLWNAATAQFEAATPALWIALFSTGSAYSFQSVINPSDAILAGTTILAVRRTAPAATALLLPNLVAHFSTGRTLKVVDWSSGIFEHRINITTPDGSTIMRGASWQLFSTAAQLSSVTLYPSPDLNGWVIAP